MTKHSGQLYGPLCFSGGRCPPGLTGQCFHIVISSAFMGRLLGQPDKLYTILFEVFTKNS